MHEIVAAPVSVQYHTCQHPMGAVDYADETLVAEQVVAVAAEEEHNMGADGGDPAIVENSAPAPVEGPVANLIPVAAALEALSKSESLASQLKDAIERIEARKRLEAQMEENEIDIKFWEQVS